MKPPRLVSLASILVLVACSAPEADGSNESTSDLVGGREAARQEFPATLRILKVMGASCTATKVGDNLLLTAAHCVGTRTGELQGELAAGRELEMTVRGPGGPEYRAGVVKQTILHPRYVELCRTGGCWRTAPEDRRDAPDLAVIRVESGLEGVASAAIDTEEARPDEPVTIVGYGCHEDASGERTTDGKLRSIDTKIVPTTTAIHRGGLDGEPVGLENIRANYVMTPGPASNAGLAAAGLCDSDGGGAVYRKGTNVVTGVNASYTFLPDGALPVTNWHARVDGQSRWGGAAWLQSLGATMSRACTAQSCRAVASR